MIVVSHQVQHAVDDVHGQFVARLQPVARPLGHGRVGAYHDFAFEQVGAFVFVVPSRSGDIIQGLA